MVNGKYVLLCVLWFCQYVSPIIGTSIVLRLLSRRRLLACKAEDSVLIHSFAISFVYCIIIDVSWQISHGVHYLLSGNSLEYQNVHQYLVFVFTVTVIGMPISIIYSKYSEFAAKWRHYLLFSCMSIANAIIWVAIGFINVYVFGTLH
jgi:hypothetical protein